jgi:hypothetical protein
VLKTISRSGRPSCGSFKNKVAPSKQASDVVKDPNRSFSVQLSRAQPTWVCSYDYLGTTSITTFARQLRSSEHLQLSVHLQITGKMSESKGISLRTKRKGGRPAISAPQQISGPVPQTEAVPRSTGGKASFEAPPQQSRPPQTRPQISGKVGTHCRTGTSTNVIYRHLILSNGGTLPDSTICQTTLMLQLHQYLRYHLYQTNLLLHPIEEEAVDHHRVEGLA